ncbi:uncharacterized protein LOC127750804 [Frankliniella occidentalis]|uniref:Uncharacterized protein LOC127750804 n=1 Tax=Frankliniella occidentalis TaxID=133901 RepID=A0A9C6X4Z2_FRAOC|nr:uncharacterized protein LOC127750804 [Frankliniella occidentalis]
MGAKKKRCCVSGCSAYAVSGDGKTVFHFPPDMRRRRKWLKVIGNIDLLLTADSTLSSSRFVCPAHFENNMFWDKFHQRLQRHAVPTKFGPNHQELSESQMVAWDSRHGIATPFIFSATSDQSFEDTSAASITVDKVTENPEQTSIRSHFGSSSASPGGFPSFSLHFYYKKAILPVLPVHFKLNVHIYQL